MKSHYHTDGWSWGKILWWLRLASGSRLVKAQTLWLYAKEPHKLHLRDSKGKVSGCVHAQWLSHVWLFWDPVDCSPPGSSVHGILQARLLKWVAISSSEGSSQPGDQIHVSNPGHQNPGSPALADRLTPTVYLGSPKRKIRSISKWENGWMVLSVVFNTGQLLKMRDKRTIRNKIKKCLKECLDSANVY